MFQILTLVVSNIIKNISLKRLKEARGEEFEFYIFFIHDEIMSVGLTLLKRSGSSIILSWKATEDHLGEYRHLNKLFTVTTLDCYRRSSLKIISPHLLRTLYRLKDKDELLWFLSFKNCEES